MPQEAKGEIVTTGRIIAAAEPESHCPNCRAQIGEYWLSLGRTAIYECGTRAPIYRYDRRGASASLLPCGCVINETAQPDEFKALTTDMNLHLEWLRRDLQAEIAKTS